MRDILKYLFPVPKEDSKRVVTFANTECVLPSRRCGVQPPPSVA